MDFCTGGSVKDLITKFNAPLNEEQIAGVLVGSLSGLLYLHNQNIIHRDLKGISSSYSYCNFFLAANILLTEEGTAKLADFGI